MPLNLVFTLLQVIPLAISVPNVCKLIVSSPPTGKFFLRGRFFFLKLLWLPPSNKNPVILFSSVVSIKIVAVCNNTVFLPESLGTREVDVVMSTAIGVVCATLGALGTSL